MPQPTTATQKSPVDFLPSLLHAIFVHTANVFSDPRRHNPRAVVATNAMIRVSIPVLIDRFQMGLDCLEFDILRAKATFRRDLEIIRQCAEEEANTIAEGEAEEKALVDVRGNQGQTGKEIRDKVGLNQVAAANKLEKHGKNQKLNPGLTDTTITLRSNTTSNNLELKRPTSISAGAMDTNMLYRVGRTSQSQ